MMPGRTRWQNMLGQRMTLPFLPDEFLFRYDFLHQVSPDDVGKGLGLVDERTAVEIGRR